MVKPPKNLSSTRHACSQSNFSSFVKASSIASTSKSGSFSTPITDATITVPANTSAGELSENGIDLGLLPPLPANATFTGLAYDVSTKATFTGSATVCFNIPAISGAAFANLQILHLENNVWQNRTTTRSQPNLCAAVSSLSPFAIVQAAAPTAAGGGVGGRITNARRRPITNAVVSLTDMNGRTVSARVDMNGRYRFADVVAGATYVLSVKAKGYLFSQNLQVINLTEEVADIDFVGSREENSRRE